MGLESATFIQGLVSTNPVTGDPKSQGDDHFRLIKGALKNTFPSADRAFYFPKGEDKTADYSAEAEDQNKIIFVDATADDATITLPSLTADDDGWMLRVIKTDASNNPVIVAPPSGTINGVAELPLYRQFSMIEVFWDGAEYHARSATIDGSIPIVSKTANATLTMSELRSLVSVAPAGASATITLPPSVDGEWVAIRLVGADKSMTIDGNGAETINNAASVSSSADGAVFWLVGRGGDWDIIALYAPEGLPKKLTLSVKTADFSVGAADIGVQFILNSTSDRTATLSETDVLEGDLFYFKNINTGSLIIDADTIDGGSTSIVGPGRDGILTRIGSEWVWLKRPEMVWMVADQKASGTVTDTMTADTWNKRDVNTTPAGTKNEIAGSSVASDQITLPAGRYRASGRARTGTSQGGSRSQIRLRDVTNNVTLMLGVNTGNSGDDSPNLGFDGEFTLSGTVTIEFQIYPDTNHTGVAADVTSGEVETYLQARIERIR